MDEPARVSLCHHNPARRRIWCLCGCIWPSIGRPHQRYNRRGQLNDGFPLDETELLKIYPGFVDINGNVRTVSCIDSRLHAISGAVLQVLLLPC